MPKTARIPTNLRTLHLLEVLGRSDRPMTATEINGALGLPKQTVHRLCATLEREGFLTRQGTSRQYKVARRLRDLGAGLLFNSRDHIARHQILTEVSQHTGETVNFVVPEEAGMNYVDRVETDWAFRIQLPVGTHVPFHCTASGKCFLASLSEKACSDLVSSMTLTAMTEKTHVTVETLLADLAEVRSRGYALDAQEFMAGMVAIAVPVTDAKGRFIAALAVHGPAPRLTIEGLVEQQDFLFSAAQRLRDMLFTET